MENLCSAAVIVNTAEGIAVERAGRYAALGVSEWTVDKKIQYVCLGQYLFGVLQNRPAL